jgi:hypothetical protein
MKSVTPCHEEAHHEGHEYQFVTVSRIPAAIVTIRSQPYMLMEYALSIMTSGAGAN